MKKPSKKVYFNLEEYEGVQKDTEYMSDMRANLEFIKSEGLPPPNIYIAWETSIHPAFKLRAQEFFQKKTEENWGEYLPSIMEEWEKEYETYAKSVGDKLGKIVKDLNLNDICNSPLWKTITPMEVNEEENNNEDN